jgi:hypothetical protein
MKYLFSFILIGLFALTVMAQEFPQADLIINGVGSGTPYATVIRKLGKPQRQSNLAELDECTQGRGKTLFYDGFEIDLMGDENGNKQTVLDLKITSPKWTTDKGVKIGDNYKTVLAKYGKTAYKDTDQRPTEEKVFTGEKWLTYEMKKSGPGGVTFYFKNDRLIRIELKATTC